MTPLTSTTRLLPCPDAPRLRVRFLPWAQRQATAGFSLIEVMCAVLVLGIGLAGLTEGLATAVRSTRESQLQTTASHYAAGLLETLRAEGLLEDGETEGECETVLAPHRWRQSIAPTDLEGLHDVALSVSDPRTGKTLCELRTLLFEAPGGLLSTNTGGGRAAGGDARRRERRNQR